MNKKYDWEQTEQFFLNAGQESGISLKDISRQFVIPYQTVRRYAAKNEWHSKRYRAWLKKTYNF